MRILGHNLLPFSVLAMSSGWAASVGNGIPAAVFLFDSVLADQTDASFNTLMSDMRNLYNNSVAATRIVLRPTTEGLIQLADQQEAFKARSGSVYSIKNGATIHYPTKATPVGYNGAANVQINTGYATSKTEGNRVLFGQGPGLYQHYGYAGIPHDVVAPYNHLSTTDLEYDQAVTIDAVLSDVGDISTAAGGTIAPISDAGVVGTAVSWSILANQEGNMMASSVGASKKFRFIQTSGTRRVIPVTASDVGTAGSDKTITWGLVVIQDTNYGVLTNGNYSPVMFACDVGALNSGALIELFDTVLSPGEFPIVAQVRTATEV